MREIVLAILMLFGQIKGLMNQTPTTISLKSVAIDVPFTSQAPDGHWEDSRFEDGCEETAVLMAVTAMRKSRIENRESNLNVVYSKAEILKIAEYEMKNYGSFVDTSVFDTNERIIKGYFKYTKSSVQRLASSNKIVLELMRGNLVIVPTNGKLLFNPNFKNGGPERHNLLIKGYDLEKKEFITNDPGTRNGRNYRYKEDILFDAIRDYPTGDHVKIVGEEKWMIVVSR